MTRLLRIVYIICIILTLVIAYIVSASRAHATLVISPSSVSCDTQALDALTGRPNALKTDDRFADVNKTIWNPADVVSIGVTSIGLCYITGYDTCFECCGKTDGITASGVKAVVGRTVAMCGIPFGTRVYISGIGERVVEDRGVGPGVVDVCCRDHDECFALTGWKNVYIVKG